MKYSHLIHHDPQIDGPGICARCGAPVAWEHVIEQDDGELVSYGSTCVKVILGQQLEEEEAQRSYQRRERERERVRRAVAPTPRERKRSEAGRLMAAYFDALLAGDEGAKAEIATALKALGY